MENYRLKIELIGSFIEEDAASPIINFLPKKIDLASKKLTINDKRNTKNIENIQKLIENNLNSNESLSESKDQLNKSTKIEKNNNLHKLIEKILIIKDNENMEKIIKKYIKKLRKYCYKFRKKKKKTKRYKSYEHKFIMHNKTSKHLNIKNNEKERKLSNFKITSHHSSKKQKICKSVKNKRKPIKIKTLNEDDEKKLIIQLHKMNNSKPLKISENNLFAKNITKNLYNQNDNEINISNDEPVPYIYNMRKELMHSTKNNKPFKYEINIIGNPKSRNNLNIINKKKVKNKNTSLFFGKELEKLHFSLKRDKKDKIEFQQKKNKVKKQDIINCESLKNLKIRKLKLNTKKNSQKKFIESPLNKNDNYSNCNTYYYTNIYTHTQYTNEKNNNIYRKKKIDKT